MPAIALEHGRGGHTRAKPGRHPQAV